MHDSFRPQSVAIKQDPWFHTLPQLKILSDIDDTLMSSGGKFPAGIDRSYPSHTIYPGVLSFYRELDLHTAKAGIGTSHGTGVTAETDGFAPTNLVFLSARPHTISDFTERKSYKLFEELQCTKGMHAAATILAGDLRSSAALTLGNFAPVALKKFSNFYEYAELYPEHRFAFVGDNGQGDVEVSEYIKETCDCAIHAKFPAPLPFDELDEKQLEEEAKVLKSQELLTDPWIADESAATEEPEDDETASSAEPTPLVPLVLPTLATPHIDFDTSHSFSHDRSHSTPIFIHEVQPRASTLGCLTKWLRKKGMSVEDPGTGTVSNDLALFSQGIYRAEDLG